MLYVNKNILFENFAGRATPLQKKMIEDWLQHPVNVEFYYECLDEWENSNPQFVANAEIAFKKILQTVEQVDVIAIEPKKSFIYQLLSRKVAVAAILFLLVGSGLFLSKDVILYQSITTNFGQVKPVTLPDGSVVTLNANSTIKFPRFGFGKNSREVFLFGEADFSIVHTASNQKFIVKTDKQLDITVLGTQFTVYARESEAKVVLRKGKVELSYLQQKTNKKMIMKPGDLFVASNNGTVKLQQIQNPEKLSAWKNHDFSFEATSLNDISKIVKDDFGVEMKFETNELANKKITGTYHADTIEELVDAIVDLLDINYKTKENSIYLFQ